MKKQDGGKERKEARGGEGRESQEEQGWGEGTGAFRLLRTGRRMSRNARCIVSPWVQTEEKEALEPKSDPSTTQVSLPLERPELRVLF